MSKFLRYALTFSQQLNPCKSPPALYKDSCFSKSSPIFVISSSEATTIPLHVQWLLIMVGFAFLYWLMASPNIAQTPWRLAFLLQKYNFFCEQASHSLCTCASMLALLPYPFLMMPILTGSRPFLLWFWFAFDEWFWTLERCLVQILCSLSDWLFIILVWPFCHWHFHILKLFIYCRY